LQRDQSLNIPVFLRIDGPAPRAIAFAIHGRRGREAA
jgi:hypothetical protein